MNIRTYLETKERKIEACERLCEYSLYCLVFFTPISKALVEVSFALALIAFCVKKILKPDFKFLNNPLHIFIFMFIFFSAFSLFNSGVFFKKSLSALFFKWLEYLSIFIIVEDTFFNYKRLRNAIVIFLSGGFLISIDGLFQYFFGIEFIRGRGFRVLENGMRAITASFHHNNDLGGYLLIVVILIIALLVSPKLRFKYYLILVCALLFSGLSFLFTFSRSAYLALFTAVVLLILLSRKFIITLLLLCIFVSLLFLFPALKEDVFSIFKKSAFDRLAIWQVALRMIKENPFLGKGLGTFMDYHHLYAPKYYIQYAHNCFLQIWAETGIFALISFLGFLTLLLFSGIRKFMRNSDFVALGFTCGITGFLTQSFFDTNFYSLQLSVLFWAIAGILYSLSK